MTAINTTTSPQSANQGSPVGRTPGQMILRWLALTVLAILAAAALVYIGDYLVFLLRGQPLDQIVVTRYMAAPLKGNKTEFYYEGTGPASCAKALFPQNGSPPCWYLRRHPLYAEPA
ncbi:hypothetical protein [Acidicapsa acidisoli]|uniref:hypothetical protein n=1 Tax=Acidicapsa acidisoli TaxID=1615681 RepID=UPI0021E06B9D|nr:hypothetical protein [Acidicapsa acidisoli]